MMNIHSKYDNMNKNDINYALRCTKNPVVTSKSYIWITLECIKNVFLFLFSI